MKIYHLSFALAALALTSVLFAQAGGPPQVGGPRGGMGRGGPRMSPTDRMKHMLSSLNLTAAQKKKTDHIIDEMGAKLKTIMPPPPAGGGRPKFSPEMRTKFDALRKEYNAKIAKVLTPAQNKKLEEMRDQMRSRFGGGMRGPGGPGGAPGPKPN